MKKRIGINWIVAVIAILGVLAWQVVSIVKLYQFQNDKFISRVNHKVTRVINELNLLSAQKPTAVSIDRAIHCLTVAKGGKIKKCSIQGEEDLAEAELRALYDIRDTALWSLDKLYTMLRQKMKIEEKSFPAVIYLSDSLGNGIDRFEVGHIYSWLTIEADSVKLGFSEKHVLKMEFMFPLHLFWKRSKASFSILFIFLILLVVCIVILTRKISRDKKRTIGQHLFLNTVMHNLRSPLDYMSVARGIIYKECGGMMKEKHRQLLEGVGERQDDMGNAITRLLTLSDIFHRIEIYPRMIHLKEMFEKLSVLNFVQVPLGKHVKINICCDMKNPEISADPVYLPVVFENLIGNAIKYSGESVTIDIPCQERGKWVEIRVKDNGLGISPKGLKHIFEIYYRDPSVREDRSRKGFGIGLSFVHSAVKAHHGNVSVNSVVNEGTEFIIILPCEQWERKWIFCTRKMTNELPEW